MDLRRDTDTYLPVSIRQCACLCLLERFEDVRSPEDDAVGDQTADSKVLGQVAPRVGTGQGGESNLSKRGFVQGKCVAEDVRLRVD